MNWEKKKYDDMNQRLSVYTLYKIISEAMYSVFSVLSCYARVRCWRAAASLLASRLFVSCAIYYYVF